MEFRRVERYVHRTLYKRTGGQSYEVWVSSQLRSACSGDVHLTGTPLRPGSGSVSATVDTTTSESSSAGESGDKSGCSLLVETMLNI
jgi:hypothetical protein